MKICTPRLACWLLPFLLLPAGLSAQQFRKLDPVLTELREPATLERIRQQLLLDPAEPPETQPLGGSLELTRAGPAAEPFIGIFLRVRDPAVLNRIRALGGSVGSVLDGSIATARVPLSALDELAADTGIEAVDAGRTLRVEHDESMEAIHVDEIRTLAGGEWTGATGKGAIVGVYDTGLDLRHEDFIDATGATRVLGLWDQTGQGTPPQGFAGGHYCSQDDIQLTIISSGTAGCPQRDFHGHGTHVAGSAAGDGSSSPSPDTFRWAGVAPGADLLIVNGGPGVFFETRIIDGLTWMRQEGLRLGKPIVVNLSLGGQFGPHDGTRLFEKAIDALSAPGFIVVISSGNNGVNGNTTPPVSGRLIHARGFATGMSTTEFTLNIPNYTPNPNSCSGNAVNISAWSEAVDQLRIEVMRPNGSSAAAQPGVLVTQENSAGRIRIDNASSGVNPENGDNEAQISIDGCGTSGVPEAGTWRIRVTPTVAGSGQPYDFWIYKVSGIPVSGGTGFDNRFVTGSPGNARRAVTAGAFVTRLCWPSIATAGQFCYTQREETGDIARFSGAGPTRDGRSKPEITAPGLGVISALSRDASATPQRVAPDGLHSIREGTSMAAPHVTGAIAVLFEVDPNLTPEDVKGLFATTSTGDAYTVRTYDVGPGGDPGNWWGYGKLNVRDALLAVSATTTSVLDLEAKAAAPSGRTLGAKGTRLVLLDLHFEARGSEAVDVTSIGFDVAGNDPGARLLLVRDNNNGLIDPGEQVVGSVDAVLTGGTARLVVYPTALRIQPSTDTPVLVALELSGAAPHGSFFEASFVPEELHSLGVRSGKPDVLDPAISAASSGEAEITLLEEDALLSFSANPVRTDEVIFNFSETPELAAVYTLTGRRVLDMCSRGLACGNDGGATRFHWNLRNGEGERVAPAVYLIVFRVGDTVIREKLIVMTPGGDPDESEYR